MNTEELLEALEVSFSALANSMGREADVYASYLLEHPQWERVHKSELPKILQCQKNAVATRAAARSAQQRIEKKMKKQAALAKKIEAESRLSAQRKAATDVQMQELRAKHEERDALERATEKEAEAERRRRIADERAKRSEKKSVTMEAPLRTPKPKKTESCARPRPHYVKVLSIEAERAHTQSRAQAEADRIAELSARDEMRKIGDAIQRGD